MLLPTRTYTRCHAAKHKRRNCGCCGHRTRDVFFFVWFRRNRLKMAQCRQIERIQMPNERNGKWEFNAFDTSLVVFAFLIFRFSCVKLDCSLTDAWWLMWSYHWLSYDPVRQTTNASKVFVCVPHCPIHTNARAPTHKQPKWIYCKHST